LRLGVHEVTNFSSTGKVHLHFEKFDEQGIFYNYILYVDFANIRLRYNPIIYGDNLTIRKALQEADNLAAYSYEKLSETKALILSTLIDVLPRLEGTEAFERLEQTVMM